MAKKCNNSECSINQHKQCTFCLFCEYEIALRHCDRSGGNPLLGLFFEPVLTHWNDTCKHWRCGVKGRLCPGRN
jgi:hypothetical protein